MTNIRIVIGGPSNSGKSVFARYLQKALRQLGISTYHYDYDPYSRTRLMLTGDITPEEREESKKKKVSKKEAKKCARIFKKDYEKYQVVVGDLPGRVSDITEILATSGTLAIIVCDEKKTDQIEYWQSMFKKLNIKIICTIHTNLNGVEDIDNSTDMIFAKVTNLDRNNMTDLAPAHILALSKEIMTRLSL